MVMCAHPICPVSSSRYLSFSDFRVNAGPGLRPAGSGGVGLVHESVSSRHNSLSRAARERSVEKKVSARSVS